MRSVGFPHLAFHIARKDWAEAPKVVVGLTLGLMVPALLVRFAPGRSDDFAKSLLAGLLAGAGFGYAQFCFLNERLRGTLEFMLSLPIEPRQLVLAKFVSLYSMVLFTVNVPGLFVPDLRLIYITNAAALSLATVFMATTVISDKAWASQIPIWFLLVFVVPIQRILSPGKVVGSAKGNLKVASVNLEVAFLHGALRSHSYKPLKNNARCSFRLLERALP